MVTKDGASLAAHGVLDKGFAEVRIRRALLAARRLTNAVEEAWSEWESADNERVSSLRADADVALYDAEVALGLDRDHPNNPAHAAAARLPNAISEDTRYRLLQIERDYDLLERAAVACNRRANKDGWDRYVEHGGQKPDSATHFGVLGICIPDALADLAAKRIAELTSLEVATQ